VLRAIADPVRLRLLSLIATHPGGQAAQTVISATGTWSRPYVPLVADLAGQPRRSVASTRRG